MDAGIGTSVQSAGNAGNSLTLILPFKLITWNRLYNMHWRERHRYAKFIHDAISRCIQSAPTLPTRTGLARKLSLTDFERQEYYRMIVPSSSRKYATRRKKERSMKQE